MRFVLFILVVFLIHANASVIRTPRQIVTGQSAVATPDGGIASVPAGSKVVDANAPVPGIQTDPNRASVVSLPGGGLTNIPPGSKLATPGIAKRQIVTGQSAVATPDGGIASVPAGSRVVDPSSPVQGIQTDPNRASVVSLPGGGLTGIPAGSKVVPPGRLRRQIVTGQSAVATPGGGIASVPAGSQVVDANAPVPGIQTDPNRASVVSLPGGGLTNIPPGSKVVPGK
uniref:Uncharacterized protein n=1 Tax=Panagrolaimus sp. PS1159 TaxID=55785 RepID=A0AC35G8Y3_9BILA